MLTLLTTLALAQDPEPYGESVVEEPVVINPALVAEDAAAEQALLDSFLDETPSATSSASGIDTSWAWVGGFLLLGVAFAARKKLTAKLTKKAKEGAQLEVIARHGVGHQAGLVLLECQTGDGGSRRLLVGVSAQGSPTLVADLGGDIPGFAEITEVTETCLEQEAVLPPVVETLPEVPSAPKRALVGRFTDADLAPIDASPLPGFSRWEKTPAPRNALQDHLSLVDEVLCGRQVWEAKAG
ncbi:MAG TPA: hypothetical protein QGF58_16335 [Myxococcota bacterium]|nr:hypothetical protein [Myxococcota bacterium]